MRAKPRRYFKIEPGIPIPEKRSGGNSQDRHYRYPFAEMEVGDSFLCPDNTNPSSVDISMRRFTTRLHREWAFTRRILEDGTVRVWRIK